MFTYYNILGINPQASQADIESAYLKSVATYKENSLATYGLIPEPERVRALNEIEEAFNILKSPETRAAYDKTLPQDKNDISQQSFKTPTTTEQAVPVQNELPLQDSPQPKVEEENTPNNNHLDDSIFSSELSYLKQIRELQKISLRQLADETRISINYLKAIEEADYEEMPEKIYAIGFIKIFAQYLGLEPEKFVDNYKDKIEPKKENE